MRSGHFLITGLILGLTGCANVPYWQDPRWIDSLGSTVQGNIQYPDSLFVETRNSGKKQSGKAVVQFNYDNGKFDDIRIIKSTGNSQLDRSLVNQIALIEPPKAQGTSRTTPHRFQLTVKIGPYQNPFFARMYQDLLKHARYVEGGSVVASFEYKKGKVLRPAIVISSGLEAVDSSVMLELQNIRMPPPPKWLGDKTLQLEVPFCFSASRYDPCQNEELEVRYVIKK